MLVSVGSLACITFAVSAWIVGYPAMAGDPITYHTAAARLLNTGVYSYLSLDINSIEQPNAFITPGVILLLSSIYLFLPHQGDTYEVLANVIPYVTILHFVCAVATVLLVSATARRIGGVRLGWIAGVLAALYLPFGAESMSTWPENVRLVISAACLYLAVGLFESSDEDSVKWMIGYGLCGGIAVMIWPSVLLWLLVPMGFWGWRHRDHGGRAIRLMLVGCMSIAFVMTPWIMRNAITLNQFIPLTTHAGTVWIDSVGGIELSESEIAVFNRALLDGKDGYRAVAFGRLRAKWNASPLDFLKWKLDSAWALVRDPWTSQLNPSTPPGPDARIVYGEGFRMMNEVTYAVWISAIGIIHRAMLTLAVIGAFLMRRRAIVWLLASVPLYYLVIHTIMHVWTRYFYVAMPAVLLLASICLGYMAAVLARRRDSRTAALAGRSMR